MFIDATDELTLKKAEQLKQKLIEHKKYDDYTAEDIALVRVTDHLPIDGIINFAYNLPIWGIQVAMVKDCETIASVIYFPKLKELYCADETGAYLKCYKCYKNYSIIHHFYILMIKY